jgi:hypothetical protein
MISINVNDYFLTECGAVVKPIRISPHSVEVTILYYREKPSCERLIVPASIRSNKILPISPFDIIRSLTKHQKSNIDAWLEAKATDSYLEVNRGIYGWRRAIEVSLLDNILEYRAMLLPTVEELRIRINSEIIDESKITGRVLQYREINVLPETWHDSIAANRNSYNVEYRLRPKIIRWITVVRPSDSSTEESTVYLTKTPPNHLDELGLVKNIRITLCPATLDVLDCYSKDL